jgi:hypothetical protein
MAFAVKQTDIISYRGTVGRGNYQGFIFEEVDVRG